jgi:Protein HRI1
MSVPQNPLRLLPSRGTALKRLYCRNDNEEPKEQTSSIFLCSPSGRFVTIQIYLRNPPEVPPADEPKSGVVYQRRQHKFEDSSNFESLKWAVAGVLDVKEPDYREHWQFALYKYSIDADEEQPTRDDARLQFFDWRMKMIYADPADEIMKEELWIDLEPPLISPQSVRLRDQERRGGSYVVFEYRRRHDETKRGLVIVSGNYCQGIIRRGSGAENVDVERWEYNSQEEEDRRDNPESYDPHQVHWMYARPWTRTFRTPNSDLPCTEILMEANAWTRRTQIFPTTVEPNHPDKGHWEVVETDFVY